MNSSPGDVERVVRDYLIAVEKMPDAFDANVKLFADGAGLDSLETAELSVILEDEFGTDPYSEGQTPETVGDIVNFYSAQGAEAL